MSTAEKPPAVDQEQTDAEEVMRLVAAGRRVADPELRRRVTERGDEVRREMRARGATDIAVDLIRSIRDED